jgi:hypothetical protein
MLLGDFESGLFSSAGVALFWLILLREVIDLSKLIASNNI